MSDQLLKRIQRLLATACLAGSTGCSSFMGMHSQGYTELSSSEQPPAAAEQFSVTADATPQSAPETEYLKPLSAPDFGQAAETEAPFASFAGATANPPARSPPKLPRNADRMFHMMSCFSLAEGISDEEFSHRHASFVKQCSEAGLIAGSSALGERQAHPVMDTDQRSFTHCFTLTFADRAHCDAAVKRFYNSDFAERAAHEALFAAISEPEFFCWSD